MFRDSPCTARAPPTVRTSPARCTAADVAWLDQVIRILRVVRTPQIGHRLDLRFLTDAFRVALPPIAEDEINQLADGWEQLQRLRDERDTTEQALAAVTEFTRQRWRPWADSVIRAAADPVAAVASRLTQITREEKNASDAVESSTPKVTALEERIEAEERASALAAAQREALRDSRPTRTPIRASLNAQQLAERADGAEKTAGRSRQRADEARQAIATGRGAVGRGGRKSRLCRTGRGELPRATWLATRTTPGLVEVTARYLPDRDTERLRQAARLRGTAADEARRSNRGTRQGGGGLRRGGGQGPRSPRPGRGRPSAWRRSASGPWKTPSPRSPSCSRTGRGPSTSGYALPPSSSKTGPGGCRI